MADAEFKEPLWRVVVLLDVSMVEVSVFEFYEHALRAFEVLRRRGASVELRDPSGRCLLDPHHAVHLEPDDDGLVDAEPGLYRFDGDGPGGRNTGRYVPVEAGGSGAA